MYGEFQVGAKIADFDRWALSVRFTLPRLPRNKWDFVDAIYLMRQCANQIEKEQENV